MRTCYAVCDFCVEIDDGLKARIKNELIKIIRDDEVTAFINGFECDNAAILESILSKIGFSGEVNKTKWQGWVTGPYDVLMAIEHGRTDFTIRLIRTAWSVNRKCSVIWI